jgi:hypothetical protein
MVANNELLAFFFAGSLNPTVDIEFINVKNYQGRFWNTPQI